MIEQQPKDLVVQSEADASFSVQATAEASLVYVWFFDGEELSDGGKVSGSRTATLTITGVTDADAGSYHVVVGDGVEEIESTKVVLIVDEVLVAPTITTQPEPSTVKAVGDPVSLKVEASGSAPLKYEWFFKGSKLSDSDRITGAATQMLIILDAIEADSGEYRVTVSNDAGAVQSQAAVLTVDAPVVAAPTIATQPASSTVELGATASLKVVASGGAPLKYEWFFKGSKLADSTRITGTATSTLTIVGTVKADSGEYRVTVSNDAGAVQSQAAVLTVNAPVFVAPTIATQPAPSTVGLGATASLKVVASGGAPLKYEWFFKGSKLADSTRITGTATSTLTIIGTIEADSGEYQVTVSNDAGAVQSQAAVLTVTATNLDNWTIIVYGHADHNLSQSLITDIKEMEKVGSGSGLNIVVQADFDASAANVFLPPELKSGVTRFLVNQSTNEFLIESEVIQRLPETSNMDDPKVLEDFVTWAMQKYPAKRYGLVLWNHGGQYEGFGGDGQDGTLGSKGVLSTLQISSVLKKVRPEGTGFAWDFIGFDTCLMGGAEVLYDFAPLTDVFIACPELDYGPGWNYEVLKHLKENPAMTGLEFGLKEATYWKDHHLVVGREVSLALGAHSIYDLRKFAAFDAEFRGFATALLGVTNSSMAELSRHRLDTTQYSIQKIADMGEPTDFADLGEFADRLVASTEIPDILKVSARRLVASIDEMVVSKVLGNNKLKTHGLSVYFPVNGSVTEGYTRLTPSTAASAPWLNFLLGAAELRKGDKSGPELTEELSEQGAVLMQPGVSLSKSAAVDASSKTILFRVEPGDDLFSYIVSLVSTNYTGKANEYTYLGDISRGRINGPGAYNIKWDGKVAALSDGKASPVILGGAFQSPGSDLFVSYAEAQYPGEQDQEFVIIVSRIGPDGGVLLSVLDGMAETMAPRGIDLEEGTILTPLYYMERRTDVDPSNWDVDLVRAPRGIVVPANGLNGLKVVDIPLPQGGYHLEVLANDMYLNPSSIVSYPVQLGDSVSAPKLGLKLLATGSLELRWQASVSNFVLEQSVDVGKGWAAVATSQVRTEGTDKVYSVPATGAVSFFRLKKN